MIDFLNLVAMAVGYAVMAIVAFCLLALIADVAMTKPGERDVIYLPERSAKRRTRPPVDRERPA